ncbi:hypothetical protein CPB83DRAFT_895089 [Crepidotus variabilis]|uniref:Uncharacterized protein n=1 Tax=Crepidotus variabilis TaxID=179855 RepID=A0A9P6JP18_9AGAR|nr:hypothetical protein CPB83DRAFT_895089 [Crepidotus variabilis]
MTHSSTAFFQGANSVQLEGTTINSTTVGGNIINNHLSGAYGSEFQQLIHHCLLGALVDSNKQYDAPQCEEETRETVIQQMDDWGRSRARQSSPVMRMRGGVGAGKSTLAQTIAMTYKRESRQRSNYSS